MLEVYLFSGRGHTLFSSRQTAYLLLCGSSTVLKMSSPYGSPRVSDAGDLSYRKIFSYERSDHFLSSRTLTSLTFSEP